MRDRQSPVGMFFEMQRDSIRQTGDLAGNVIELSVAVGDTVERGVETQREIQEGTIDLLRESTHQSLEAFEAVSATTESTIDTASDRDSQSTAESLATLREGIDTTFDSMLEQQAQSFATIEGQHEDVSEELLDALDCQIDTLLQYNERIEARLGDTAEYFVEQADQSDDLLAFEKQLERFTDQFERHAGDRTDQFETIEIQSGH